MLRVFTFHYTLKDTNGNLLDSSSEGPLAFLEGAQQIIPALEKSLLDLQPGEKLHVPLKAEDAYGLQRENLVMDVDRSELAHLNIEVGGYLQLELGDQLKVVRITKVGDQKVTLDGNHPLAGQDLNFDIEMVSVRPATAEELSHGHAHGPGGHHHH